MSSTIRHDEIIQSGDPFAVAHRGALELLNAIDKLKQNAKVNIQASLNNLANATPTTSSGRQAIKDEAREIAKLNKMYLDLHGKYEQAEKSLQSLTQARDRYNKLSKDTQVQLLREIELSKQKIQMDKLQAKENAALAGSYAQLSARLAVLKNQQKTQTVIGSKEYRQLGVEIRGISDALTQLDAANGVYGRNVGNYMSVIRNAWIGIAGQIGIYYYAAMRVINKNADLSDSMADVRKTTQMSQGEVEALNKELRGLNTRTAQKSLLDLGVVAGKLGIAKEEILGFIRAADMIGVSLGRDLGDAEQAVNALGKMVAIFRINEKFGFEQALMKTGSALRDLGNDSTATEEYIVDFTKRMGGIAPIAKVNIQNVMALGATMDQLGQTAEVSSTAFNAIWIGMAKDTAKFAEIAGMNTEAFADLMRSNFTEAFIKVAEGMQKSKGGIMELAHYFDGLGLDGRRIINVMAALSTHIDTFRHSMDLTNDSFDKGTSLAEQFAIKNESLGAKLDKVQKFLENIVANEYMTEGIGALFDKLIEKITQFIATVQTLKILLGLGSADSKLSRFWDRVYGEVNDRKMKAFDASGESNKIEQIKTQQNLLKKYQQDLIDFEKTNNDIQSEAAQNTKAKLVARYKAQQEYVKKIASTVDPRKLKDQPFGVVSEEEAAKRKKALEDARKLEEAYYQVLLKLGMKSVDEIVAHERAKLQESGVWKMMKADEVAAWEKQARIDAQEYVNKRIVEMMELSYDEQIAIAQGMGDETYIIERERLEKIAELYVGDVEKYRRYKLEILKLDIEFAKKRRDAQNQSIKSTSESEKAAIRQDFENRLSENELAQSKIKSKKKRGSKRDPDTNLTPMDSEELKRLSDERNIIIQQQTDFEVSEIQKKINAYKSLLFVMSLMGGTDPQRKKEYEARISEGESQIQGIKLAGEQKKQSGSTTVERTTETTRPSWDPQIFSNSTIETFQAIAAYTQVFANGMNDILGSISERYQQDLANDLEASRNRYDAEYEMLDLAVAKKTMSERTAAAKKLELEKKQKAEEAKIQREYAKKQQDIQYVQAIVNIALGVTQALAQGGVLGILSSLAVVAAGAIQLDTIASQKFAKGGFGEIGKEGKMLKGKRHTDGGINLPGIGEAEDGEYFAIINRKASSKYKRELPELFTAINEGRYEKMFDKRGLGGSMSVSVNDRYGKEMLGEMRKSQPRVYEENGYVVYETGNYRLKTHKS